MSVSLKKLDSLAYYDEVKDSNELKDYEELDEKYSDKKGYFYDPKGVYANCFANGQTIDQVRKGETSSLNMFAQGYNPRTGDCLVDKKDAGPNRRPGYDFTQSVPKSVSVLWAKAREVDPLLAEFIAGVVRKAAEDGVDALNKYAGKTRDRSIRDREAAIGCRYAAAIYQDFTARPVDAKGNLLPELKKHITENELLSGMASGFMVDPQLHCHTILPNMVLCDDGQYRAVDGPTMYRWQGVMAGVFHASLARQLRELGFELEDPENLSETSSFELKGFCQDLLDGFSKRSLQVENNKRVLGYEDADRDLSRGLLQEVKSLNKSKHSDATAEQIEASWSARMKLYGFTNEMASQMFQDARERAKNVVLGKPSVDEAKQVLDKLLETESVISDAKLRGACLHMFCGQASEMDINAVVDELIETQCKILDVGTSVNMLSSQEMIDLEKRLADTAREYKYERPFDTAHMDSAIERVRQTKLDAGKPMSLQQEAAIRYICSGDDGVVCFQGRAGAGKTYTIEGVREVLQAAGMKLIGTSLSWAASRNLADEGKLDSSAAIADFVTKLEHGKIALDSKTAIIVDEAGIVGSRDLEKIVSAAKKAGAFVVLAGDTMQVTSVAAGGAFRMIIDEKARAAKLDAIAEAGPLVKIDDTAKVGGGGAFGAKQEPDFTPRYSGVLISTGSSPYQDKEGAKVTPWAILETAAGKREKIWGVDLKKAIDAAGLKPRDRISLDNTKKTQVAVTCAVADCDPAMTQHGTLVKHAENNQPAVVSVSGKNVNVYGAAALEYAESGVGAYVAVHCKKVDKVLWEAAKLPSKDPETVSEDAFKAMSDAEKMRHYVDQARSTGSFELTEVRRQKHGWDQKAGLKLAHGNAREALEDYMRMGREDWQGFDTDDLGRINIAGTKDEAIKDGFNKYLADMLDGSGKSQLMISFKNDDVQSLNRMAHKARQEAGLVQEDVKIEVIAADKKRSELALGVGDIIQFRKKSNELAATDAGNQLFAEHGATAQEPGTVYNRTRARIEAIKGEGPDAELTVRLYAGDKLAEKVYKVSGRDFKDGALPVEHAYCMTVDSAQGQTFDRSYLIGVESLDRARAYVACTRHREELNVHVSLDRLHAVAQGNWSNTEFVTRNDFTKAMGVEALAGMWSTDKKKITTRDYEAVDKAEAALATKAARSETERQLAKAKKEILDLDSARCLNPDKVGKGVHGILQPRIWNPDKTEFLMVGTAKADVRDTLKEAVKRWGSELHVSGDKDFQRRVVIESTSWSMKKEIGPVSFLSDRTLRAASEVEDNRKPNIEAIKHCAETGKNLAAEQREFMERQREMERRKEKSATLGF